MSLLDELNARVEKQAEAIVNEALNKLDAETSRVLGDFLVGSPNVWSSTAISLRRALYRALANGSGTVAYTEAVRVLTDHVENRCAKALAAKIVSPITKKGEAE